MLNFEDSYRISCRRLHRIIASYLAFHAWHWDVDYVILSQPFFCQILTLDTIQEERLEWFRDDVKIWFPYFAVDSSNTLAFVHLSRKKIDLSSCSDATYQVMTFFGKEADRFKEPRMVAELIEYANGYKKPNIVGMIRTGKPAMLLKLESDGETSTIS